MSSREARSLALAVSGLVLGPLALTGCATAGEAPIVSEPEMLTNETLDEQRRWIGEQLDAAVAASGVASAWYDSHWADVTWGGDRTARDLLLESLLPQGCSLGGRLVVTLLNDEAADPLGAVERVRAFWESEGWAVSDVSDEPAEDRPYFRADRADGAHLAFSADRERLVLRAVASCSAHTTVTHWEDHADASNEFQSELDRREGSAR